MIKASNQLTVGELIAALRAVDAMPVTLESGEIPGDLRSYRGYYEDLAIEIGLPPGRHAKPLTAGEFAVQLASMLGRDITGYKGGHYQVTDDTAVWVSEWGECSGDGVTGVMVRDGKAVITTEYDRGW